MSYFTTITTTDHSTRTLTTTMFVILLLQLFARVSSAISDSIIQPDAVCTLSTGLNAVYLSIFEDHLPNTTIAVLPIEGRAYGLDADIELRLIADKEVAPVDFDPRRKELRLISAIERDGADGQTKLDAVIECRSLQSSDHFQVNISIVISIKDVNDNAPIFDQPSYAISIAEELPIGTIVLIDLEANDADQDGPNSHIRYDIVDDEHKQYSHLLAIPDPYRGIVRINSRIDFESTSTNMSRPFSVKIRARDEGIPMLESIVNMQVNVIDVDDRDPQFEHDTYEGVVNLDNTIDIYPAPIRAFDGDTAINASIIYSLSGDDSDSFNISSTTGQIRQSLSTIVRSTTLIIHANQIDRIERSSRAMLIIRGTDDNNNHKLHFDQSLYSIQILSSTEVGTRLVQVHATVSQQQSSSPMVIYSLDDENLLRIDNRSGEIYLASPIVNISAFQTRIFATLKAENDTIWSQLQVYIITPTVFDVRQRPVFDQPHYEMDINRLGRVQVIDNSESIYHYYLANFNDLFSIDTQGHISVLPSASIVNDHYELVVFADDDREPPNRSFTTVIVRVRQHSQTSLGTVQLILLGTVATLIIGCLLLICFIHRLRKRNRPMSPTYNTCWPTGTATNKKNNGGPLIVANPLPSTNSESHTMRTSISTGTTVAINEPIYSRSRYDNISICDNARSVDEESWSIPVLKTNNKTGTGVTASPKSLNSSLSRHQSQLNGGAQLVPVTVITQSDGAAPTVYF